MSLAEDFIDAVAACKTIDAVGVLMAREIARHGYTSSICNIQRSVTGERGHVHFRNWTQDWIDHAATSKVMAHSPIITAVRVQTRPFSWRSVREGAGLSAEGVAAFREAADFGWIDGLVVPIHVKGGRPGAVSMATQERDVDISAHAERRLASIGYLAFQRCEELDAPPTDSVALTGRELECFRWVAMGKTDYEIGMILGISKETVKFHLERGRGRLNAATRAHGIAKLALAGLL
ncbi:HTH-type quorum sensing-dependent transcriptional regulator RpaR [Alphaproteobacteria bacterium SO-S41]|nr:HTH-type quorum sensing-dependent transcriptional regulator RpaR [Alphaproteobacteria bacterium SO-S41]